MKRYIRPDGYFMLETGQHRIRYLLEIDRSTEDNPRFLREKILPGLAYVGVRLMKSASDIAAGVGWLLPLGDGGCLICSCRLVGLIQRESSISQHLTRFRKTPYYSGKYGVEQTETRSIPLIYIE